MKPGNKGTKAALKRLLTRYAKTQDCDPQSAMRDLLTDLRHLADEEELDLYAAFDGSYEAYLEERAEARE